MAKENEEFTFETITQVFREERNSATLTKLPRHFYQNLTKYTEKLKKNYLEQRKDDPTSSRTMMLEDEHKKAQRRSSQIYELRERKIALLALSAANEGSPNLKHITEEEKNAFDKLVDTLLKNRSNMMLKKEDACESKTFLSSKKEPPKTQPENEIEKSDITFDEEKMNGEQANGSSPDDVDQDNPVVLILEDIPSFEIEERTFNLKKDDVITLPKNYAKILCKRKKARVILGEKKTLAAGE